MKFMLLSKQQISTQGVNIDMKNLVAAFLALLLVAVGLPAHAQIVLVGSFGQDAEMLSYGEMEDGAYSQALLVDGGVLITTGRDVLAPGVNDTLDAAIASAYPDAYDILIMDMDPVAGYPAERIRFYQGDNEDTHIVDYVYVPTDAWVFYAEISVPMEWRDDYEDLVDAWVASIDLFDDGFGSDTGADSGEQPGDPEVPALPLEWSDLSTYVILTDEDDTVLDLVEMFAPDWFTWLTDEETGALLLTLECEGGVLVIVPDSTDGLNAESGAEGASDLPDAVLQSGCDFVEAQWQNAGFPLYPLRGLYVGDPMQDVLDSYDGGDIVSLTGTSLEYDEAVSYTVAAEAPVSGEAVLTYYGVDGLISCIQLSWFASAANAE